MTAPRTVLVVGASGGCGTSLVAGAVALAWRATGAASWLIESESGRGDLAESWDLPGDRTLDDLRPVLAELTSGHLRAAAREHPSGLDAIVAPRHPSADAWDADGAGRLIHALSETGGACVVDGGSGLAGASFGAAMAADRVLLVCPPRVPAARRALAIAEVIDRAGRAGACGLVVAAGPGRPEIGARALSRAVGVPVEIEVPWSPGEAAELGAGRWPRGRARRGVRAAVEGMVATWA